MGSAAFLKGTEDNPRRDFQIECYNFVMQNFEHKMSTLINRRRRL